MSSAAQSPETYTFRPGEPPAPSPGRSALLWEAPGSIETAGVRLAYEHLGNLEDMARVSGPWAVLLYDRQTGEHILAGDPVGQLPVFWARTADGRFAVGAWIAELLQTPGISDALDYDGILIDEGRGLTGEQVLHRTRFREVQRVPWGRALRIRPDGRTRLERYWFPERIETDEALSLQDSAELLRERIDLAIRRLLPVEGRVGGHVSGGLDCTAMVCRANQILAEDGRTVTAGYSWTPSDEHVPRFPGDERGLLDDVEAQEQIPIRRVHPDESGDWWMVRDPNRYPQSTHIRERYILPQAKRDGIDVMLSGWGGDELASFNGRKVTAYLARTGQWGKVWTDATEKMRVLGETGQALRLKRFAGLLMTGAPDPVQTAVETVRHPNQTWQSRRNRRRIEAELAEHAPFALDLLRQREDMFGRAPDPRSYRLGLLTGGHIQHRTGWWYQTGRLFNLHYRYPLLDVGVVEAALALPWWAFRSEGWSRVAYRTAVAPWVPTSVAWNVGKYEPALFWPESRNPVKRSTPPPRRIDLRDEQYRSTMRLVSTTYSNPGQAISTTMRVSARPDAAPRS